MDTDDQTRTVPQRYYQSPKSCHSLVARKSSKKKKRDNLLQEALLRERAVSSLLGRAMAIKNLDDLRDLWLNHLPNILNEAGVRVRWASLETRSHRPGFFFFPWGYSDPSLQPVEFHALSWVLQAWKTGKPVVVSREEILGEWPEAPPKLASLLEFPLGEKGSFGLSSIVPDAFGNQAIETVRSCAPVLLEILQHAEDIEAIRQSEERYRNLVNLIPAIIFQLDPQARFVYINPEIEKFGYKAEGLWGRPLATIFHPEDAEKGLRALCERRTGKRRTWDLEVRLKRGAMKGPRDLPEDVPVLVSTLGLYDVPDSQIYRKDKKFLGTLGVARDISSLKRVEAEIHRLNTELERRVLQRTEELREQKRYLSKILQSMQDTLVVISPSGRIRSVNDALCALLGYQEQELLGAPIGKIFAFQRQERVSGRRLCSLVEEGALRNVERAYRSKGGSKMPVLLSCSVLRADNGAISGIVCVAQDLSERKRLERALLDISEAEQKRIGQDLHDGLGQDLTAISLLSKTLEQKVRRLSATEEAEDARQIVRFLNQTVVKTRALARGLHPMTPESESLQAALAFLALHVEEIFGISCKLLATSGAELRDSEVIMPVYRIAQEAINNAIRHGKARRIVIRLRALRRHFLVAIEDDGIGLPEKLDDRRGMGIALMRHRAHVIGASVQIQNQPRGGAEVVLSIPKET